MAENVTIKIKAQDEASATLRNVRTALLGVSAAAAAAAAALAAGAFAAAKASAEQATGIRLLDAQLRSAGTSYAAVKGEIEAFAAAQQKATRFGDTETRQALQRLVGITGSYTGSLEQVALAQDVAEATGRSLNESLLIVGKAAGGNLEALGEMIPAARGLKQELGSTATAAQRSAAAMQLLHSRFDDAAKNIDPFTQALARVRNTAGDVGEAFGDIVLDSGFLQDILGTVSDILGPLEAAFDHNRGAIDQLGKVAATVARGALTLLVEGLFRVAEVGATSFAFLAQVLDTAMEPVRQIAELLFQLGVIDEPIRLEGLKNASQAFIDLSERIRQVKEDFDNLQLAGAIDTSVELGPRRLGRRRRPSAPPPPLPPSAPLPPAPAPAKPTITIDESIQAFRAGTAQFIQEDLAGLDTEYQETLFSMQEATATWAEQTDASFARVGEAMRRSLVEEGAQAFTQFAQAERLNAGVQKASAKERINAVAAAVQASLAAIAIEAQVKALFALGEGLLFSNPAALVAAGYYQATAVAAGAGAAVIGQTRGRTANENAAARGSRRTGRDTVEDLPVTRRGEPDRPINVILSVNTSGSNNDEAAKGIAHLAARAVELGYFVPEIRR